MTKVNISDLTPEQVAQVVAMQKDQVSQQAEAFVNMVLPLCRGKEVTESKQGNSMIKNYVNYSSGGFRVFGTLFIMNKKTPTKLKTLI